MVGWLITYAANYAPYLLALVLMLWPLRNFAIEHTDARFCCPEIPRILAGCLVASAVALILGHGFYDDWGMRVTLPLSIGLAAAVTQVLFSGLKWPLHGCVVGRSCGV